MYERIKAYVRKWGMLEKSDIVIAGISGGPDSICLLCVLIDLSREIGFQIAAVHVNHGLRGAEADADEAYVSCFCEEREIPLMVRHADVRKIAARRKISGEEAGREVRREAYEEAVRKYRGTRIALAHHMNDNAETLLLNMARGTGVRGMAGIRPVNGRYIRPLLCVKRREIEQYLEENNLHYCIDRTNMEDIYTRNRIRNHIIPCLEEQINSRAVEHLEELAEQMGELSDYVERQASRAYERCVRQAEASGEEISGREEAVLDVERFLEEDPAIRPYLVRRLLACAAKREKDIEAVHVRSVEALAAMQSGRKISLPYGLCAERRYGEIYIYRERKEENPSRTGLEKVLLEGGVKSGLEDSDRNRIEGSMECGMECSMEGSVEFGTGKVSFRVFPCEKMPDSFPQTPYTKWFDYDIIKNSVVIRTRQSGDYITIDNQGNTQKIKKYFINEKIPNQDRDHVLLVADGSHIMWIVGYRQDQSYQVSEQTRRILEIRINGGKEHV